MLKKLTIIIVILVVSVCEMTAQVAGHEYARVVCNDCDVNISDSLFYKIARTVTFPVNKYDIPKSSDFYRELVNDIIPEMNSGNYRLEHIIMRGAASPEGPYSFNAFLAKHRLMALYELIDGYMDAASCPDCLTTSEMPEDYEYLLKLMKEHNDKYLPKVADSVGRFSKDPLTLQNLLMKVDNGRMWQHLLNVYFPSLRSARVVLVFKKNKISLYAPAITSTLIEPVAPDGTILSDSLKFKIVAPQPPIFIEVPVIIEKPIVIKNPRRELLSVKTNLLMDFAYMPLGYDKFCPMPNVGIEYYPLHGHFTWGAHFDIPWHQDYDGHKYFQARNYQLETRYYFRSGSIKKNPLGEGAAFRGFYLQGYGHAVKYGIMFDADRGWVGEGAGAGLGLGYVVPLTKPGHLRLELGAQFGYFYTKYDPFQYECPVDPTEHDNLYYYKWTLDASLFKERQYRFTWLGPTKAGITLTWDLLYRKRP